MIATLFVMLGGRSGNHFPHQDMSKRLIGVKQSHTIHLPREGRNMEEDTDPS